MSYGRLIYKVDIIIRDELKLSLRKNSELRKWLVMLFGLTSNEASLSDDAQKVCFNWIHRS